MSRRRIRVEKRGSYPSFREEWTISTASFSELVEALKSILKSQGYSTGQKTPRRQGLAATIYGTKRLEEDHKHRIVLLLYGLVGLVESLLVIASLLGAINLNEAYRLLDHNFLSLSILLAWLLGIESSARAWFYLFSSIAVLVLLFLFYARGGGAKLLEDFLISTVILGLVEWARSYTIVVQKTVIGFYVAGLAELIVSLILLSLARETIYYASLVEIDLTEVGEVNWWKKVRTIKVKMHAMLAVMELAGRIIKIKPVHLSLEANDLKVLPEARVRPVLYRIGEKRAKVSREERLVNLYSQVKSEFNAIKTLVESTLEDYRAEEHSLKEEKE